MKTATSILLSLVLLASIARGDEIEDALTAALTAYKGGDIPATSKAMRKAQDLINAKASLAVASALPDAIGEWKAGKVETQNMDAAGGGSAIQRSYKKGSKEKGTEKRATVVITADSSLMKTVQTGLSNPALGSLLGTKVTKIGDQEVLLLPKQGILQMIVTKRYLVAVQAKKLSETELLELAAGVKTDVLKAMP